MLNKGRILVLDDEIMIQQICCAFGQSLGFDVTCVSSGDAAVEVYRQAIADDEPFEMGILDLTIPNGMGGAAAARAILQIDPSATLIVASGDPGDPICESYFDHGFADVIFKPFGMKDFRSVVERFAEKVFE